MPPKAIRPHAPRRFRSIGRARPSLVYRGIAMQLLNPGEAYGTLRLLSPCNLIIPPVAHREIVILSRLPNELPLVGGTIPEELRIERLEHINRSGCDY